MVSTTTKPTPTVSLRRRLGINLLWNTLNTWGSTALTVSSSIVYARLLQPSNWGTYSTLAWLVSNFALLTYIGWNLTINKFVAEAVGAAKLNRAALVFQIVVIYEFVVLAVIGSLLIIFTPELAASLGNPAVIEGMPLVLFGVVCMVLFTTCNMVLIALQHYKVMSLTSLFTSIFAFTAGITWLLNGGSFYGIVVITACANLVNVIVSLVIISRLLPIWRWPVFDGELLKKLGKYCLAATILMILGQIVYERIEVFFLSNSQSVAEVGYYSLAVAMTNMAIGMVPNIVIGPLLAMSADLNGRNDKEGLYQLFSSATRLLIIIAPPLGIGGALVAWPIIRFMYGESYTPVAIVAMILLPPGAFLVITKPANSLLWGLSKQGLTIKSLVPGAILNITLDIILIPRYGLYAAALSSTFAQTLTSIFSTYIALHYLKYKFPWMKAFRAGLAALLMVPFGLVAALFLDGLPLILVQIFIGAITYPLGLMLLKVFEPGDYDILKRLEKFVPGPLKSVVLPSISRAFSGRNWIGLNQTKLFQLKPSQSKRSFLTGAVLAVGLATTITFIFLTANSKNTPGSLDNFRTWGIPANLRATTAASASPGATGSGSSSLNSTEETSGVATPIMSGQTAKPTDEVAISKVTPVPTPTFIVAAPPSGKTSATGSVSAALYQNVTGWSLASHTSQVYSVAFSPDGLLLASGGNDSTIKLWDVYQTQSSSDALLATLDNTAAVYSVTFSPDGSLLAGGSADGSIRIWQLSLKNDPVLILTLKGHKGSVNLVTFSPDSKIIASAGDDKTIKLWDTATGELLRTLQGHTLLVNSVAFSPDGKTLASGSNDRTARLWETASGKELVTLTGHTNFVNTVAFSPAGNLLASGSSDNTIKFWDTKTFKEISSLSNIQTGVISLAFSPDGLTLASGGNNSTITLWDVSQVNKGVTERLNLQSNSVGTLSIAFSSDGKKLASASRSQNIKLWSYASNVFNVKP